MSETMTLPRRSFPIQPVHNGIHALPTRRRARRSSQSISASQEAEKAPVFPMNFPAAQNLVFRLALRITRNQHDAEDAQQEALLKAYRNLNQFQGRSRFTTWLSSIAINEALMSRRRNRSSQHVEFEDYVAQNEATAKPSLNSKLENAEEAYQRKELGEMLSTALVKLSRSNRDVFVLRALEGLSMAETAEHLSVSVSAVKTRMRRARLQLQKLLRHSWQRPALQARMQHLRAS